MKIGPMGAELFHADGQTYDKTNSRFFRNFAKTPTNEQQQLHTLKT